MEKTRILVVEDEGVIGLSLKVSLEKVGYDVPVVAASGEEAIHLAAEIEPHLVLIDIRLPGALDGVETALYLRQHFNLPVVYLTANADDVTLQRAKQTYFFGYLLKPFNERELYATIEMALIKHQAEKQLEQLVTQRTSELDQVNQRLQAEIATRERVEDRLLQSFLYDQLTKLPNRTLLLSYLSELLQQVRQDQNYLFTLLQLDLDRFKLINDSLGYQAGNQLLVTIARRLEQMMRPDDMVAYLGEDEFAILLHNASDPIEIGQLARQIQDAVAKPVTIEDHQIVVTACVGIVLMDKTLPTQLYQQPEEIVRDTDVALHQAKTRGRAQVEFFDISFRANSVTLLEMERHLRQALERQEFRLYYQPLVSLTSGRIVGVEALLRWQNPAYGSAPPQDFITLLDDSGLIVPVGMWVLRAVCTQLKAWHEAGHPWLRAAVNLSACQLRDPNLPTSIETILAETGLTVAALELEITEGVTIQDADLTLHTLQQLGALGLRLAIDDFGMGYSSLDRLKRMPAHTLKIDKSFVRHIYSNSNDSAIVSTVVTMAHRLGLKVIAEGIETLAQLQFLRARGCDEGQGFLFSPPLSAEAMTQLLHEGRIYA